VAEEWESHLERWLSAGLVDRGSADRIREFERAGERHQRFRWPIVASLAFGGLALGSGVLLFVAAQWPRLGPGARFGLILALAAVFHVCGAFAAGRFEGLAITLHALGTLGIGAAIQLAVDLFDIEQYRRHSLAVWAAGAWVAWYARRDWPQVLMAIVLTPAWLVAEWAQDQTRWAGAGAQILGTGLVLLATAYMAAVPASKETTARVTAAWTGSMALIPCVLYLSIAPGRGNPLQGPAPAIAWAIAVIVPMVLMISLRRQAAQVLALISLVWVIALAMFARLQWQLLLHAWCATGAVALVFWGVRESRAERINLGFAGFGLTILFYYFSSIMDRLGRAASLMGLGVLFLAGGWALERARRRLIGSLERSES
jgi:uncharacterized membrane protein